MTDKEKVKDIRFILTLYREEKLSKGEALALIAERVEEKP